MLYFSEDDDQWIFDVGKVFYLVTNNADTQICMPVATGQNMI
jgi:hypothetical protein